MIIITDRMVVQANHCHRLEPLNAWEAPYDEKEPIVIVF
jgi:hypothetical protein